MTDVETPPSTITELRQILIDYEAARPRSMQKALGPSELGTPCQQQIARKLAGAPRRPITEPTWAPFQGTAVHASMEQVVAFWNAQLGRERWLTEDQLTVTEDLPGAEGGPALYPGINGRSDAYDCDHDMVVDWKHSGITAFKALRAAKRMNKPPHQQIGPAYRVQGHLYGYGQVNKGRQVKWIRVVLLARSHNFDQSEEWTEAYKPAVAEWAIKRYRKVVDLLHHHGIEDVPAAPSADTCKWCPYSRPGQPSDWYGCAGDEAAHEQALTAFTAGIV